MIDQGTVLVVVKGSKIMRTRPYRLLSHLVAWIGLLTLTQSVPGTTPPTKANDGFFYAVIEAEEMRVEGDWREAASHEGHCPAYPQFWSANRLRGGAGPENARAESVVEIPSNGTYAVWVRYESPHGFDTLFDVAIHQGSSLFSRGKPVFNATFGDRDDLKAFGAAWRVQGPWSYHNADFVCQKGIAQLKAGKARVVLLKGYNGKNGAVRMIDLIAITDDLEREQAVRSRPRPWAPENLVDHCKRPFYFRVRVSPDQPARVGMAYSLFSPSYGLNFRVSIPFTEETRLNTYPVSTRSRNLNLPKGIPHEALPANHDTGWQRYDLSTLCTAEINFYTDASVTFSVSRHPDGRDAQSFYMTPAQQDGFQNRLIVGTGFTLTEEPLLGDHWIRSHHEISQRQYEMLAAYQPPGRRPFDFIVQISGLPENLGPFYNQIKYEAGRNLAGYEPELYQPETAKALGINRPAGGYYFPLHNRLLNRQCYEGNYERYRQALLDLKARAEADNMGDIPWLVKLIEESGPPPLFTLRTWPLIVARFRDYLQSIEANPAEMLDGKTLAEAIAAGKTGADDLWPRVNLSDGSIDAARQNPKLFYHSKIFAANLFVENLAHGVRLIEEILPSGSAGDLGCAWTQDGHAVRRNWYDEMMLFRHRGATAFGTENTWGLCGMPHYIGPQTESYQGALARACAKYHDDTRLDSTTAIFSWHSYGYPPEYPEMVAYAMAANGIKGFCFATCGEWATPEILRAWKRAAFALGGVEDRLVPARNVPGKVALGWSETTAIWDQAIPTDTGFRRPGNLMYQLERHYLYLLLRHMQLSVELLSDADIEEGRLSDYEVFFMVGDHTTGQAAREIRDWVARGGTLVAGAGGGLFDEFNRPLDTLTEVYGIKGQRQYAADQGAEYIPGQVYADAGADNKLERLHQAPRAKLELIHLPPVDSIRIDGCDATLPVLAARQTFSVAGGDAIGAFSEGQAAIVTNGYGKGTATIMGFLPGVSYFHDAFPKRPYGRGGEDLSLHLFPANKPLVRNAIQGLLQNLRPGFRAPVQASNPFVEANLMRHGDEFSIALVNFSGRPLDKLTLSVVKEASGDPVRATSAYSEIDVSDDGQELTLTLPLDKFDFVSLHAGRSRSRTLP